MVPHCANRLETNRHMSVIPQKFLKHIPTCRLVISGAANIDRTGWLAAPSAMGCSNPGWFDETPGGTALNVASVVATLGAKPELVSLVAQDAAGNGLRAELKARGVDAQIDGPTRANTGTYTCVIEPDGSLLIGLADMAIFDGFSAQAAVGRIESLTAEDWICVDTNLPPQELRKLLGKSGAARKIGLTVSKAKAPRLKVFIDQLDLVFTNRVEVGSLCGISDEIINTANNDTLSKALADIGIASAVITDGTNDVTVIEHGKVHMLSVRPVKHVADVTGAGDALVGASIYSLMCGVPLVKSVEIGIKAAQVTIQSKGAWRSDLARLIGLTGRGL